MTVVNINTGEVIGPVSLEDARRLTDQIKSLAGAVADGIDRLVERIREAQTSRVHEVLGYRSWTEYVSTEFAGLLPRLDREPRRELVTVLADTGMTTRTIAPIVGVGNATVHRDLASVSDETDGPIVRRTEGKDGRVRTYATAAPENKPEVEVAATDDEFWTDAADKLTENGWVAAREAERPYSLAVITLCQAAEDVAAVTFEPESLAANLPERVRYRLPEIERMADYLTRFVAATKEQE